MTTISVSLYEPSDPRLGRHVEHDTRSRSYLVEYLVPQRATTHWPSTAPPLDQGKIGSCVGNAVCQWANTDYATTIRLDVHKGQPFFETDAVAVYSLATTLDAIPGQYPPHDSGTSALAGAKAAVQLGYFQSYSWAMGFDQACAALEHSPVLLGTLWTDSMFRPVNGLVTVGSLDNSHVAGGHEYLGSGIDYDNEVIECRNSWGDTWAGAKPGGYFAITFADFQRLLDTQGDVLVPQIPSERIV